MSIIYGLNVKFESKESGLGKRKGTGCDTLVSRIMVSPRLYIVWRSFYYPISESKK